MICFDFIDLLVFGLFFLVCIVVAFVAGYVSCFLGCR